MPQFELAYFSSQIFWLLICFSCIYIIAKKFFMPKISNIIDERNDKILQLEEDSKNLTLELSKINEKIESVRKESVLQYSKIISDAKEEASKLRAKIIQENQSNILKLQNKSDILAKETIKQYSQNSDAAIDRLIVNISNKLTSKKIN